MDDAARTAAKCMEDEPGEISMRSPLPFSMRLPSISTPITASSNPGCWTWSRRIWSISTNSTPSAGARFRPPSPSNNPAQAASSRKRPHRLCFLAGTRIGNKQGASFPENLSGKLRCSPPGLIHHSDRGSQYAAAGYRKLLSAAGMIQSMSRKGNCWDCESVGALGGPDPCCD
jgi:hypothetical protein